jgi:hypothetical protein
MNLCMQQFHRIDHARSRRYERFSSHVKNHSILDRSQLIVGKPEFAQMLFARGGIVAGAFHHRGIQNDVRVQPHDRFKGDSADRRSSFQT